MFDLFWLIFWYYSVSSESWELICVYQSTYRRAQFWWIVCVISCFGGWFYLMRLHTSFPLVAILLSLNMLRMTTRRRFDIRNWALVLTKCRLSWFFTWRYLKGISWVIRSIITISILISIVIRLLTTLVSLWNRCLLGWSISIGLHRFMFIILV